MLTERIKELLGNVEIPEEEIETLCTLLTTVSSRLDTPKAWAHFDVYFSRMQESTKNKNVSTGRMFMLQVSVSILMSLPVADMPSFRMSSTSANVSGFLVMPLPLPLPQRLIKFMNL
jgi:hypothetical protein